MRYILGIDGGGTKTVALAADLRGNILGRGAAGASNYHSAGLDGALAALKEASENAVSAAGVATDGCEVACLGLAGAGRETDRALLLPAIRKLGLADTILLQHDAAIALAGATVCQPGVVILAGTGAMAFGMNRWGEERRAGGWGNVLGDEGSAYYIGRRALAAACRAYDGRGTKTALVDKVMGYLGLDHFTDIVKTVSAAAVSALDVAFLAPLVSQLAECGDEVSLGILRDAAQELALAANAVIRGLRMEDEKFQFAASGSVFKAGEIILAPLSKSVKLAAPRAEIISPRYEPAVGAVLLALRESGVQMREVVGGGICPHSDGGAPMG